MILEYNPSAWLEKHLFYYRNSDGSYITLFQDGNTDAERVLLENKHVTLVAPSTWQSAWLGS